MRNQNLLLVVAVAVIVMFGQTSTWAKEGKGLLNFWNASHSLILIDSQEKKVGRVIGIDGLGSVINQRVGVLVKRKHFRFALEVRGTKLVGTLPLLFETTDCSGPPLMRKDEFIETTQMFPPVALAGENPSQPGQVVYVPDREETPIVTSIKSWISQNEPCSAAALTPGVVNARRVADLSDLTPPFDVKLNRR